MSQNIPDDQIEIINDFLQESRDMLDHLEPTIIELGQSCQNVDCWETLSCSNSACKRHGQRLTTPCWLDEGFVGEGCQACAFAEAESDCRGCQVFELINGNTETMNAIFRLFHSMKGSAGFLEFDNISHVAHQAENLLDLIRSGKIKLEADHVDLLCQSCDFARAALDYVEKNYDDQGMADSAHEIADRLGTAVQEAQEKVTKLYIPTTADDLLPPTESVADSAAKNFEVDLPGLDSLITPEMLSRFVQEGDELLQSSEQGLLSWAENPGDTARIAELFRDIHSLKGNCGFFGFGDLERLGHQMETILDSAKAGTDFGDQKPQELLLQMVDVLRSGIADIADGGKGKIVDLQQHIEALQELSGEEANVVAPSVRAGVTPPPSLAPATPVVASPASQTPGAGKPELPIARPKPAVVAPENGEKKLPAPAQSPASNGQANKGSNPAIKRQDIRVDLEKLDKLINLIGEMVIAENMLVNNPDLVGLELENFGKASQQMSKIVRELQEMAMAIRMIPVSGLFRRMIRLVHDISVKSGKKVELELYGEETEVDKTVIEQITDPLVHLLRNSLDHGLEPPQERLDAGKTEKGVVRLSAKHEEGEVWITVEDDGRGLNREKIIAKAISKGLIQGDGSDMTDRAVFNLIFQPGFSTAEKITDISGRGVGMDVVRQNLDKIKGKIEVISKAGQGTKIRLRIPLTLAIIDGLMIRVGKTRCIVPLLAVREIFRPVGDVITHTPDGQELVRVRENFISVLRLHKVLEKQPDSTSLCDGTLVILENQDSRIGLFVDEILGQQQTVIKGLSNYLGNVDYASGCTILGNGDVCLILDVNSLIEVTEEGLFTSLERINCEPAGGRQLAASA